MEHFKQLLTFTPQTKTDVVTPELPANQSTLLPENFRDLTLGQLGGDSMAAMRLSGLIREQLQVEVTADVILHQPLGKILEVISGGRLDGKGYGSEYLGGSSDISGKAICWEEEISLDGLGLEDLLLQGQKERTDTDAQSTVFLTGATGFLGRFVLMDLLHSQQCGRIFCLVKEREGT